MRDHVAATKILGTILVLIGAVVLPMTLVGAVDGLYLGGFATIFGLIVFLVARFQEGA